MEFFNSIPERKKILGFIKQKGLSEDKLIHSIAVTDIALNIAEKIAADGIQIDKNVVEAGALLHNIGIVAFGERDYEAEMAEPVPEHCSIGATMVLESGIS